MNASNPDCVDPNSSTCYWQSTERSPWVA